MSAEDELYTGLRMSDEERFSNLIRKCDGAVETGLIAKYNVDYEHKRIQFNLRLPSNMQYAWLNEDEAYWYLQGLIDAFKYCGEKFAYTKTLDSVRRKPEARKEQPVQYGGAIGELLAKHTPSFDDVDVSDFDDIL